MAESIGNLYGTKVPSLSDTADIQEALRVYHYGASSGSGSGEYPITNTDPTNLVIPSMAYHLYDLQSQIDNFDAGLSLSAWTEKGILISAESAGVPISLSPGVNGQVLTVNSATTSGLEWQVPQVTLLNTVDVSNKTFVNSFIADGGIKLKAPTGNIFTTTLATTLPTENKIVYLPVDMPNSSTTLVGIDTPQTLINKTIGVAQLTGTVAIANGGTNASTAANARSNLEIFNSQAAVTAGNDRTPYSGKIYVADPAIVGSTGANLDGAATGDLWFW